MVPSRTPGRKVDPTDLGDLQKALEDLRTPFRVSCQGGAISVPALGPEALGDRAFCSSHRIRFPYAVGAMANAIASVELVEAVSRAGMLGFFGAAGLPLESQ